MSACVSLPCADLGTRCTVPGMDVSVRLHPSGAPSSVSWSCPLCRARHSAALGMAEATVLRAAGAMVIQPGRVYRDDAWIDAAARQVVADAQAACLDAARSR